MAALKHLSWSALASVGGAVLDIGKIVVLARFLAPEDFGTFGIALVVVGFCQLFSEGGVGNALISKRDISPKQAGYILNFNLLVSLLIVIAMLAVTPLISAFYQTPQLTFLIPLIALMVPFSAVTRIFQAMLQRKLAMKVIAKATLISKVVGLLVAWGVAQMSFGVFALAWSVLAATLVLLLLLFSHANKLIRFQTRIEWSFIQPILSFSIYQLGELLLNFFAKNFDVLLITKFLGAEVSGLYVVCKNLLVRVGDIIVATFSRYFHPLLASVQSDKERLQAYYLNFFRSVTLCIFVGYLLVAINHLWIVFVLLGNKYVAANELFGIMAIWLTLRYSTAPVATLWLVRQMPQIGLYWNILVAITIPCVVMLSYDDGLQGVVLGLTLTQVFFLVLSLFLTYFLTWQSLSSFAKQLRWLLCILLISAPIYWFVNMKELSSVVIMFSSVIAFTVLCYLAWGQRVYFLGKGD